MYKGGRGRNTVYDDFKRGGGHVLQCPLRFHRLCHDINKQNNRLMAYINYAPMRIGTEDPWALTELAKAEGPGGFWGVPPI